MAELRREPIALRWVVIMTNETKGPDDYLVFRKPYREIEPIEPCPFCAGNEVHTPQQILSLEGEEKEKWAVRVVPNKFPFFRIEGELDKRPEGMYDLMNAIGAHEIVIETPDHEGAWARMDSDQMERVLRAYRERASDLARDRRFRQVLILKNHPGIFYLHPHSNVLALPVIPRRIDEEIGGTLDYFRRKERCIFCDIIKEEITSGRRLILETDYFLSFCPFASRYPFETWIIPKRHSPDFVSIRDEEMRDLASIMGSVFRRLFLLLQDPPYSFAIHSSPIQEKYHRSEYHWHMEIRPRIGLREGFEWATGFFVNPTPPELAATYLRETDPE
jgi:UDPglucose--hexose-1-phosphate uridylyltransferase